MAGMSLSDFLLNELREVAERPSLEEMRARLSSRSPVKAPVPPADLIRGERDRH